MYILTIIPRPPTFHWGPPIICLPNLLGLSQHGIRRPRDSRHKFNITQPPYEFCKAFVV